MIVKHYGERRQVNLDPVGLFEVYSLFVRWILRLNLDWTLVGDDFVHTRGDGGVSKSRWMERNISVGPAAGGQGVMPLYY
jgi:hypothetical protein